MEFEEEEQAPEPPDVRGPGLLQWYEQGEPGAVLPTALQGYDEGPFKGATRVSLESFARGFFTGCQKGFLRVLSGMAATKVSLRVL